VDPDLWESEKRDSEVARLRFMCMGPRCPQGSSDGYPENGLSRGMSLTRAGSEYQEGDALGIHDTLMVYHALNTYEGLMGCFIVATPGRIHITTPRWQVMKCRLCLCDRFISYRCQLVVPGCSRFSDAYVGG